MKMVRCINSKFLCIVHSLFGRELCGNMTTNMLKPSMISERLHRSCKSLGHLTAAYCVLIDVTGKYIFTVTFSLILSFSFEHELITASPPVFRVQMTNW